MTAKQFLGWERFYRMSPFGELRADHRAASIRQMVFNMAVDTKYRKPLKDFVLNYEEDAKEAPTQSWQEKKAIGMAIAMAYGQARTTTIVEQDVDTRARAMAEALLEAHKAKR